MTKVAFSADEATMSRRHGGRREETDVRGWGGPPLVRALFTLLGVAAAGLLIWLAQTFDLTRRAGSGSAWA